MLTAMVISTSNYHTIKRQSELEVEIIVATTDQQSRC